MQSLLKCQRHYQKKRTFATVHFKTFRWFQNFPSFQKHEYTLQTIQGYHFPSTVREIPEPFSSFRNRRTSYSILCLCPNVHRHSFFSHFEVTHIRSIRHQQRFPEVYLIQKFAHTEKLQYHRSNPTIYELLRTEPHDPSYYDPQDRRSLPCQQSIENHCPSPI